jgi:hypothetical protein
MPNTSAQRFQFIAHALRGDGPFRPLVTSYQDGTGTATLASESYLVRYPRESNVKFARRNEIAFYASPLALACSRFSGYISMKGVGRDLKNPQFTKIAEDCDGKGNAIDVFWSQFTMQAKARGSMLLLIDMPSSLPRTQAEQLSSRQLPFWTTIAPETLTDFEIGDDGKFDFVEFAGNFTQVDGTRVDCTWRFDRAQWSARDKDKRELGSGAHPLGECPVLIFTEGGDFPHYGPFAAIADLSKRLFNADSELDEILRSQTFSLLTMQVPDQSTDQQKLAAAQVAGQSIGTSNLMVHSGSTPAFIAPPDGPANVYLERIKKLEAKIDEIGLNVATVNQQESGIAMQMRFQAINGELSRFSLRMEDLEARAWDLSRKWLGMTQAPTAQWPRDFNLADVEQELKILAEMVSSGMPAEVIAEQQKRIVTLQFPGLDEKALAAMVTAIDERSLEPPQTGNNVVPLRPDPNAPVRESLVRMANGGA